MASPQIEKRRFPRLVANAAVIFRSDSMSRAGVGRLYEFSATGFAMISPDRLEPGTLLDIQFKSGSRKLVPAIKGTAEVMRCDTDERGQHTVSCKLVRVERPQGDNPATP